MQNPEQLCSFVEWYQRCITGDETFRAGTRPLIFLGSDTFLRPQFENDLVGRLSPSATATAEDSRPTNLPLTKTDIAKIEAVAEAGREVRPVRAEALSKIKGGLRTLGLPTQRNS